MIRSLGHNHLLSLISRRVSPIPVFNSRSFTTVNDKYPRTTSDSMISNTQHPHSRVDPNGRSGSVLCSLLKSCTQRRVLAGHHAHAVVSGFTTDVVVCNHLINMYGKCGSLDDAHLVFDEMGDRNLFSWNNLIGCYSKAGYLDMARKLFDEMTIRDSVSWNTMIAGYDRHGPCEEALNVFFEMRRSVCKIDPYSLSSVISACSNVRVLSIGKEIHGLCVKTGSELNIQVGSALVEFYGKCMEIGDSRMVFDGMVARELCTWNSMLAGYIQCSRVDDAILLLAEMPDKNLVSWTTIISGCFQHGRNAEAIVFYYEMLVYGFKLDVVPLVSLLGACGNLLELAEGCKIHGIVMKYGFNSNAFIDSALVAFYAKCGLLEDARTLIDNMDSVDDFSWTAMITEYAKHGLIENAYDLFESLKVKSLPVWNALITAFSEVELYMDAVETFKQMCTEGMLGDEFTFGSLLRGAPVFGMTYVKQLHIQTIKVGTVSSLCVSSALINMYSHFSQLETAKEVFHSIITPNIILWNALISGYGQNNMCLKAVSTFQLMIATDVRPDSITFSSILDSFASLSVLTTGMQIHALAHKMGFESDVSVGSAVLSMYGKCEKIKDASMAFSDIKIHNVVSWTALLGVYVTLELWNSASVIFYEMPERNIVSWNTMLSGHAKLGSGLEVVNIYRQMNRSGVFPDQISFVSVLTACCNFLLEEQGKQIHGQVIKTGMHTNALVRVTLHDMYTKIDKLHERHQPESTCIQWMQEKSEDSLETRAVSWIV